MSPATAHEARAPLLERLLADGVLYRSATQPIVAPDGKPARWMLDSLGVSMSTVGAQLTAACLLEKLSHFEGRQLATYGTIGIPLMQSCIAASKGRYSGLLIRKERKAHGSLKLIEGKIEPLEPVILVDDSIASGTSIRAGVEALRAAGLHVEGAVCLMRFGYDGVSLLEEELGLHVEAVFDVWHDLMPRIPGEPDWTGNPLRQFEGLVEGRVSAPERLHPSELARLAMREFFSSGKLLRAPRTLDRRYDARGGTFVSLRRREDVSVRPARAGFWCFPEEPVGVAPRDVVLAAALTARETKKAELGRCNIAVSFLGPLERVTPGALDNARYGIVVKSLERKWVMGGALPNMQGMANEFQQLRHARTTNAKLFPLERYALYRHELTKVVEHGETWQPFGVATSSLPFEEDVEKVTPFVRAAYERALGRRDLAVPSLPSRIERFFLTLYVGGALRGCVGGRDLSSLVDAVWKDSRFEKSKGDVAVTVSFITQSEPWGEASLESVAAPLRFGRDGLAVEQGERYGFLLPHVAMMQNLSPREFVDALVDKAGITRPPYAWTRHPVTTWLCDAAGVRRVRDGLPEGESVELLPLVRDFAKRNHNKRGGINVRYFPFTDAQEYGVFPEWTAHGAWVKARAGLRALALEDLRQVEKSVHPERRSAKRSGVEGASRRPAAPNAGVASGGDSVEDGALRQAQGARSHVSVSTSTLAFSALARRALKQRVDLSPLLARIDKHGRFLGDEQDFCPGQALLALGREAPKRAFDFYRRRWNVNRAWGSLPWLSLAFASIDDPFAFTLADHALEFQSEKTGAFLTDYEPDAFGALTWVTLEGLSGPLRLARKTDPKRFRRYAQACRRGLEFGDRLVYQPRDEAMLPNAGWAFGGVRLGLMSSEVRLDFVHHALSAMLFLRPLL